MLSFNLTDCFFQISPSRDQPHSVLSHEGAAQIVVWGFDISKGILLGKSISVLLQVLSKHE
jgi:hypothetical protein